jgi:hypothetical protein
MQPDPKDGPGRDPKQSPRTPKADMQPEDAGTAASGNPPAEGQGTEAESAMKQTSKTDSEAGSRR